MPFHNLEQKIMGFSPEDGAQLETNLDVTNKLASLALKDGRVIGGEDLSGEVNGLSVALSPEHLVREGESLDSTMDRLIIESGANRATWEKINGSTLLGELKKHSPVMYEHSLRIGIYAYHLTQDPNALIYGAGHDIGKLGMSKKLLESPDAPTELEHEIIQRHPALSMHYLLKVDKDAALVASQHHKHQPGGYGVDLDAEFPDLDTDTKAEVISRAKLVMVIDYFDTSMTRNDNRSIPYGQRRAVMLERYPEYQEEIAWLFEHRIEAAG